MDAPIFIPTNSAYGFSFLSYLLPTYHKPPGNTPRVIFLIFKNFLFVCLFLAAQGIGLLLLRQTGGYSLVWCAGSHCGGLSRRAWALGTQASVPKARRLGCPEAWDPPSLGIETWSPTLGGGFSCTGRMSLFCFWKTTGPTHYVSSYYQVLPFVTTSMDLEDIMLNEINQTRNEKIL